MKILVLESSTTSVKAMVYDTDSQQTQVISQKHTKTNADADAGTHDAKTVYEDLISLGRQLTKTESIDAIALSTTWHSLLLGDGTKEPISPVYLWSNLVAASLCQQLRQDQEYVKNYQERTGCIVNASYPYFKLKAMQPIKQDIYIMDQGAYLNWKFTQAYVTSESMASGSGLYNIESRDYDMQLLDSLEVCKEQLPKIVKNNRVFSLSQTAANALHIEPGIPVMLANPDGGLNQIGADATNHEVMTLSVGTSGALRISTQQAYGAKKGLWSYRSPRTWLLGTATSGACNCVDWFKDVFCEHRYSYAELEAKIEIEHALQSSPIFLPFLFGERCPGWNMMRRGGFENLHHSHDVGACYYSVLEGVLFNLYQGYERLVEVVGEPKVIELSGGILHSPIWQQMCADIFGHPMVINTTKDMSMVGAARWAYECIGEVKSVNTPTYTDALAQKMLQPNINRHQKYQRRYQQYQIYYSATQ